MVEFEKRGVPTVSFTAQGFVRDAHRSAENFGLPQLPIAVSSAPFTNQSPEAIRSLVDGCFDQVLAGLTRDISKEKPKSEITIVDEDWLTFDGDDLLDATERMNATYLEYAWSDGFPLRPATEQQMERMLSGTKRDPQSVVAVLEPGFGVATVEKIAANAVMAGCRPEHLPVLIAATELLAEPKMYLRNKAMSTGPHAPLLLINGPIRKRVGYNSGICTLGPGAPSYSNSVTGRALRLIMMNCGHTYPGISDMDTVGSPTKYAMCAAENEEESPWSAYHVEQGFDRDTSTVTLYFCYSMCELYDFMNYEVSKLTDGFAQAATNVGQVPTGRWLIGRRADPRAGTEEKENHFVFVCPDHAAIFQRAGWSKEDLRQALFKKARLPFRTLMLKTPYKAMAGPHPELTWLYDSPDAMVPVLEDPDCFKIVVVGGSAGRGALFYGAGEPITKAIEE